MTVKNDSNDDLDEIDDEGDDDLDLEMFLQDTSLRKDKPNRQSLARQRIEELREEQRLKKEMEDFMDWD